MIGYLGEDEGDCATQVEDYRLDNAGDYMRLVSSGIEGLDALGCGANCDCPCNKKNISGLGRLNDVLAGNLGPNYGSWPPGPQPQPYRWTAPNGITWTQVLLDGKYMYKSSRDPRLFISTSNLYDMMGVPLNPQTLVAEGRIPGERIPAGWQTWQIGGLGAGWAILGGIGAYYLFKKYGGR